MSISAQNMQIFTIIGQIEDLVENSPKPKIGGGGGNKRVIDAEELMDLLGDLKVTIPEDIRRANAVIVDSQSMVDNAEEHSKELVASAQQEAESIVNKANANAESINSKAQAEYERLISEDEIYQEAQRRAKLLAMKAEANAAMVFDNAKNYADDVLHDLESFLGEYKQLVAVNRKDLDARTAQQPETQQEAMPAAQAQQAAPAAQQPVAPAPRAKQHAQAAPAPAADGDDFDDDFDDEEEHGSIFSRLFGKKKKVEDMDFDDDDEDDGSK